MARTSSSFLPVVCVYILLLGSLLTPSSAENFLQSALTLSHMHNYADHPPVSAIEVEQVEPEKEKFIWPLLSDYVGAGNQLMEYMSAAVVAHALNRTLCLPPFQAGPAKHESLLWRSNHGLSLQERYSTEQLSKFVKVASVDQCLAACNRKLEATWFLKGQRRTHDWHFDNKTTNAIWSNGTDMKWSFISWTTTEDVRNAFGKAESNLRCVALGGLFPGLRWRGAYLAVAAYLTAAKGLANSATVVQRRLLGLHTKFLAVHWRFEESFCGGRELGSCFLRCGDGAIVSTGLHPLAKEWIEHSRQKCHFHGVKVTKDDVVGAIYDRAIESNLTTVYLATDGWIRGQEGARLIKQVVEMLREKNMTVVGMWRIDGLPNSPDVDFLPEGPAFAEFLGLESPRATVTNPLIAGLEQEICNRAQVFLGSGQSTWSLAVFRSRLAQRRARSFLQSLRGDLTTEEAHKVDQTIHNHIIQELLRDEHEAGGLCGYHRYYNKVHVNVTKETLEDEAPDGWLDLEACEMRIGHKGGQCEFATCT